MSVELAETVIIYLEGTGHDAGRQFDYLLDDDGSGIRKEAKESNENPGFGASFLSAETHELAYFPHDSYDES